MDKAYYLPVYAPVEIETKYPNLWATIQKYFPLESKEKMSLIASLVINTCGTCHNDGNSCQCWNDE